MDEEKQQEEKPRRHYAIEIGDEIIVYRDDIISGEFQYTFYHTKVTRLYQSGKKMDFKLELSFKGEVDIEDKTLIKVLDLREDARLDKKNKYYPIWKYWILDYEVVREASAYRTEQHEIESYQEETFY